MRRTGVWVSVFRNSFIHKISLNSCSHSGMSEDNGAGLAANNGSHRSIVVSSLFDFLVLGWLGSATRFGSKQRVSPFYHFLNICTWHRYWMGIDPTQISPFSSLTVACYCCSWWNGRAWGRCRMITLLSWRCHSGWRMRTGGRTRWQAWNHNGNEVLRVALHPNPVLLRCGFWPLIHS